MVGFESDFVRRPVRSSRVVCAVLIAGMGLAAGGCAAQAQSTGRPAAPAGENITRQVQSETAVALPSLAPIVDRVMAAVVNVSVKLQPDAPTGDDQDDSDSDSDGPDNPSGKQGDIPPLDELLRRFFQQYGQGGGKQDKPQGGEGTVLGSGFIIDPSGIVVTNNHVVKSADRITVVFQDGSRHAAKIVGRDKKTDMAVLKIEAGKPLPYVQWGNSEQARVGDWVVAVGNPFGLGGTVTAGIVSARGRDINEGPYDDFLQIDAPINRGNSGGPTFNLAGEVIGVNTAIFSPSGGSVGIGFAIPSEVAKDVVDVELHCYYGHARERLLCNGLLRSDFRQSRILAGRSLR